MNKLVLNIQKPGLGDHLFYSNIPRIAKETGRFDKVYISTKSLFRSEENKQLVWEMNPYVDGFTHEQGIYHFPACVQKGTNLLDALILLYGLDDGLRMHEPEIYYTPENIPALSGVKLYDPNFFSYTGDLATGKLVQQWLDDNDENVSHQMKQIGPRYLGLQGKEILSAASIFDFCSILVSVDHFYGLTTGSVTLAAALQKPVTVFYGSGHDPLYRHSAMHRYIDLGSDFNLQQKIKRRVTSVLQKFIQLRTP